MKKLWLILLSLGLVMAFSVSALAVDVKVSGDYYAAGLMLNKTTLADVALAPNPSTAFFFQRLRVGTDFIVSPGLKLVTRFDALERVWGGARSPVGATAADSAGTRAENENIAFDYAYIDYTSPIGQFKVGMMPFGVTGTVFADSNTPKSTIKYGYTSGPATIYLGYTKVGDNSFSVVNPTATQTDLDQDYYAVEGVYTFKDGKAGLKGSFYRYADQRVTNNYLRSYFNFTPYVIAKIGPVNVQAEINWATGNYNKYELPSTTTDIKVDTLSAFVDATANFDMFNVGGTVAYLSGDDPGTNDKYEGSTVGRTINSGGTDWNPCLIMFNYDLTYWAGNISGYGNVNGNGIINGPMTNALFFQGRAGVNPTPQLNAMLSVSYATADKKPLNFTGGTYGTEVDITGTYKITSNLSYMLGFGYLFTGDYFKGVDTGSNAVVNDFILINKLTLTF